MQGSKFSRCREILDGEGAGPSCNDVLNKLKDDGQFDKLRQKIIDRVKKNENLRNIIISKVEQSIVLNTPGAENKKPRELFDAIHDEIENPVLDLISEAVWQVIESKDGLGEEISETVESVYSQLSDGRPNASSVISLSDGQQFVDQELRKPPGFSCSGGRKFADREPRESLGFSHSGGQQFVDQEPQEPPGFSLSGSQQFANREKREPPGFSVTDGRQFVDEKPKEPPSFFLADDHQVNDVEPREPPGFSLASRSHLIGGESRKQRGFNHDGRVSSHVHNSRRWIRQRNLRENLATVSSHKRRRAYRHNTTRGRWSNAATRANNPTLFTHYDHTNNTVSGQENGLDHNSSYTAHGVP